MRGRILSPAKRSAPWEVIMTKKSKSWFGSCPRTRWWRSLPTTIDGQFSIGANFSVLDDPDIEEMARNWGTSAAARRLKLAELVGSDNGLAGDLTAQQAGLTTDLRTKIKALLRAPVEAHVMFVNNEKTASRLGRMMRATVQADASAAAAAAVDSEPTAAPETIARLIDERVRKALVQQKKELQKQLAALKVKGAGGDGRATRPKETPPAKKNRQQKRKGDPRNDAADASKTGKQKRKRGGGSDGKKKKKQQKRHA